jgi:ketosteroid isomerase-like protein
VLIEGLAVLKVFGHVCGYDCPYNRLAQPTLQPYVQMSLQEEGQAAICMRHNHRTGNLHASLSQATRMRACVIITGNSHAS